MHAAHAYQPYVPVSDGLVQPPLPQDEVHAAHAQTVVQDMHAAGGSDHEVVIGHGVEVIAGEAQVPQPLPTAAPPLPPDTPPGYGHGVS